MSHLFLEKVFEYELKKTESIDSNFSYNDDDGYWIDSQREPCILKTDFAKPRTKKEDRETGEDQKGE